MSLSRSHSAASCASSPPVAASASEASEAEKPMLTTAATAASSTGGGREGDDHEAFPAVAARASFPPDAFSHSRAASEAWTAAWIADWLGATTLTSRRKGDGEDDEGEGNEVGGKAFLLEPSGLLSSSTEEKTTNFFLSLGSQQTCSLVFGLDQSLVALSSHLATLSRGIENATSKLESE